MTITKAKAEGGAVSVRLASEIDHHNAKEIREEIDRVIRESLPSVVRLDFSAVGFMDSSGIGLIIGRAAVAEEIGAKVEVSGLSDMHRRLVRMSGIEKLPCIKVI